jgi:hypothetical protein
MKRGYTYAQAMAYAGVKRRTFDTKWRPRLVAIKQGSSLVYDRADLDRLFDEFKADAAGAPQAANDPDAQIPHNGPRNGRPDRNKGVKPWAEQQRGSTPTERTPGKLTNGFCNTDFVSAASQVLAKRKAG